MWLLDSGASAHFTFNFDMFVKYQPYVKPRHSQTAYGLAPVLGEGTMLLWFNGNVVQLSPTIYMPTYVYLSAHIAGYITKGQLPLRTKC